jgi:ferrous iron transport protein B
LTVYSPEEIITREFMINERPSLVVVVVDAANLERNLYLTVQVMEMGAPVILALNMSDVATARGITIDTNRLSQELHVPVVRTIATRDEGIDELKETIVDIIRSGNIQPRLAREVVTTEDIQCRCSS